MYTPSLAAHPQLCILEYIYDILTVTACSATRVQEAPRHHTSADELSAQVKFTVFVNHDMWLLSILVLQSLRFGFYYEPASDWVRIPTGRM